jgi:hypothetical protein
MPKTRQEQVNGLKYLQNDRAIYCARTRKKPSGPVAS